MRPHLFTVVMAGLLAGPVAGIRNPAANLWLKAAVQHQQRQTTTATATEATSAAASSASSAAPTHTIAVGATGFTFTPDTVTADVGDIIEFNFYPGNHSVVRSAFQFPCIPYEDTGPNRVGFFSGFLNTNVYSSDGPKYRIRVNDTEPIFYYCDAPGSCIDNHMLGVINPNATWTLDLQNDFTSNTTVQLSPGEPLPSEMASPTTASSGATGSSSSSSSGSTGGTGSTGSTGSTGGSSHHHHGLSGGAIAGIVIGTVAAVILLACGVFFFLCCSGRGGADVAAYPVQRRRHRHRYHHRNHHRNSWFPRGRTPDGMSSGGGGGGGNVAMLAPVSPTTASAGMATPPSFHRPFPNGSPTSASPEMADIGGGFASHTMAAAYPTYNTYNTLPLYPGMPGIPVQHPGHQLSPLQSHPPFTVPVSPPDKAIQTPSPTLQAPLPPQPPVELPAARVAGVDSNALRAPPAAALKESPTMGSADGGAWGGNGSNLDLSKGEK